MNEELKKFYETDIGFEQFVTRHNLVAADPETRRQYYRWLNAVHAQSNILYGAREEGRTEGRNQGLAEGLTKGELQKSREIAKNMKQLGIETALITKATGLFAKEIENL